MLKKQILLRRRTGPAQPSPAPAQLSSGLRAPEPPSPRPPALSSMRTLPRPATDRWDPPVGFVTNLPPESSTRTIRRPTPCSTRAPPPSSPLAQGDPLYKPRPWPRFASNRSSPCPARTRRRSRDPLPSPPRSNSEAERRHSHRLPLVEPRLSIFSTGAATPPTAVLLLPGAMVSWSDETSEDSVLNISSSCDGIIKVSWLDS